MMGKDQMRLISWKYAGLWKQAGLAQVGDQVKYLMGWFVVQSHLRMLIRYLLQTCPRPMVSNLTLNHAFHPLATISAPYSANPQSQNWSPREEQSPLALVISAKKSLLLGLTSNSKQLVGQLSGEAMNIQTTSSCHNGSLQLLKLLIISVSMLCQFTQRQVSSQQREAVVVASGLPSMQVKGRSGWGEASQWCTSRVTATVSSNPKTNRFLILLYNPYCTLPFKYHPSSITLLPPSIFIFPPPNLQSIPSHYNNCCPMIKEQVIFQEESQIYQRRGNANQFILTDEHRNNINKRLPRGFALVKLTDVPKNASFRGEIEYVPTRREPRIASEDLNKQFLAQPIVPTQYPVKDLGKSEVGVDKAGLRFSQLPEGKSKQAEKIKNILQRFRRHYRYPALAQYLQRMGFMNSFLQIQAENKKNIHTIDSFKDRIMFVFKHLKEFTYDEQTLNMINELVDQFLFHVEQARKLEFQNSLNNIQKSIDKVTREISEIKESGNYYYRKKKRNEKNYDEKEILYIAELMKSLPQKEYVGVMEIIEEKPFQEITTNGLSFDLMQLKPKKIREIEFYVKKKLSNYFKSRERKREKMLNRKKKAQKQAIAINIDDINEAEKPQKIKREEPELSEKNDQPMKMQAKAEAEVAYIFEFEQEEEPIKNEERPRSLFSFDDRSRNEFDDFLQDRPSEVFFMDGERSVRNPSIVDRNEKIDQENIEFQNPNLLAYNYNNTAREEDYDSSDSSMITDEQDSDY